MPDFELQFQIGDSVRLSEVGRKNSRNPERRGTVVGISTTGSQYRVKWDGLKTEYMMHRTYLELVSASRPRAG